MFTVSTRWAGKLIYWAGLARVVMWLNRRHPKVLMYHACEDRESDLIRGLDANTTPRDFATHLDFVQRYYTVVSTERLEAGAPPLPPRAVAITFDDGYRSVYEHAYPLLRDRAMPATVYLVSDVVDNDGMVWVNELNWLLHSHPKASRTAAAAFAGVPASAPAASIVAHARLRFDRRGLDDLLRTIWSAAGSDSSSLARRIRPYLTWHEVCEMRDHGMHFGNHTATHPSLPALDTTSQRAEIQRAHAKIVDHLGHCTSLAYPFGEWDASSRAAAEALEYRSIMEVGGANRRLDPKRIARIEVRATTEAELFSEMEVVEPIRGWIKTLMGR